MRTPLEVETEHYAAQEPTLPVTAGQTNGWELKPGLFTPSQGKEGLNSPEPTHTSSRTQSDT